MNKYKAKRIRLLRSLGHGIKDIAKRVDVPWRQVQESLRQTPEEQARERRRIWLALQKLRPPGRNEADHERIVAACFPELVTEGAA